MSQQLIDAVVGMKEEEALSITRSLIGKGEDPLKIFGSCRDAMKVVGERFEKGEFFLPELMMAGDTLRTISEIIKPLLKEDAASGEKRGKVIIATVAGDIHDIGKDIVVLLLDVAGFEVLDLGIDVPADKIIDSIKEFKPSVVGLSGFLTLAFDSMKDTVEKIKEAGLRDDIKIMIGGGQIDEAIVTYAGVDAYGKDAMEAVNLTQNWIGG
jgi:5-methyltetrahydrofolate--homocysteine methyltransferase